MPYIIHPLVPHPDPFGWAARQIEDVEAGTNPCGRLTGWQP